MSRRDCERTHLVRWTTSNGTHCQTQPTDLEQALAEAALGNRQYPDMPHRVFTLGGEEVVLPKQRKRGAA